MRLIQCDLCGTVIPQDEMNSPVQNVVKNILRDIRDYDGESKADVCVPCACNLKNSFDDVVNKWYETKGLCNE